MKALSPPGIEVNHSEAWDMRGELGSDFLIRVGRFLLVLFLKSHLWIWKNESCDRGGIWILTYRT